MNRRRFIATSGMALGGVMAGTNALASPLKRKMHILHTNDIHSRIEPFELDSAYPGQGGLLKIMEQVNAFKRKNEDYLLLDAGDIFQGTMYFNLYGGEVEFKLMSKIGYNAATLGNHDFDNGVDGLLKQMPHAEFPFVVANYSFDNGLKERVEPYVIFERAGKKVGVFGLGIALEGLVLPSLYKGVKYLNPLPIAKEMTQTLKQQGCDVIIALSHLGYEYKSDKVSDLVVAKQTPDLDIVLGGHTHTFLEKPTLIENIEGQSVIVNQVGRSGLMLGQITVS